MKSTLKRDLLGLAIGLALGVLLLVVTSMFLNQPLFGITWTPPPQYFLKTSLSYLYLRIENVSSNTPLIGGKTLIWYIAIIRIENPYNNTIMITRVQLHLPEQVYIDCGKQGNEIVKNVTVTVGASPRALERSRRIVFDSWINKTVSCSYGFTNDLLRNSAERILDSSSEYYIGGDDPRFNHMYIVITGVTELPRPWKYRLQQLQNKQYIIISVSGHPLEGSGSASSLKITEITLSKVAENAYVYNTLPEDVGFDLEGTPKINTFYNGFWP